MARWEAHLPGTLTSIWTYPVKGMRGATRPSASVEPRGLLGDRCWMLVDLSGRFLSQRDLPSMARMQAQATEEGIRLTYPGEAALQVATPDAASTPRPVSLWRDTVPAVDCGEAAASWLGQSLGVACRLVFQADARSRKVAPEYAAPGDVVNFADGFPILLTTEESLADLNARLAAPICMQRFRPNLVVQGAGAWAEDSWQRVRIGSVVLRVAKPCDRCIVTTIDPATGERPDPEEPLRTLKTFRRDERGRVYFGQNLIPEVSGPISVGDPVIAE